MRTPAPTMHRALLLLFLAAILPALAHPLSPSDTLTTPTVHCPCDLHLTLPPSHPFLLHLTLHSPSTPHTTRLLPRILPLPHAPRTLRLRITRHATYHATLTVAPHAQHPRALSLLPTTRSARCPIALQPERPDTPAPPSPTRTRRIAGGDVSSPLTRTYMASLTASTDPFASAPSCTATILSARWLLTAAHCNVTTTWTAHLGGEEISSAPAIRIKRVIPHPRATPSDRRHDVALVQLVEDAPPDSTFIRLNTNPALPAANTFARAIGYGNIAPGTPGLPLLRQVDVPVVRTAVCAHSYAAVDPSFVFHGDYQLCAGYMRTGGCDSCEGDTGGPLLQFDSDARPVQVAIVSAGFRCALPSFPAIYVRTSMFVPWMRDAGAVFDVADETETVVYRQGAATCPVMLPFEEPVVREIASSVVSRESVAEATAPSTASVPRILRDAPVEISPRIIGGDLSPSVTQRYMVSLTSPLSPTGRATGCSGSLLSARWALTAAHCNITPLWTLRVGEASLFGSGPDIPIQRVFIHELFSDFNRTHDIALVQLAEDAPSGSSFIVVNSNEELPSVESFVRAIGYGTTEFGESTTNVLRQVDIPVVDSDVCNERYRALSGFLEVTGEFQMCAGYLEEGGCDSCQGDSGGPLIQFDNEGMPIQVGLVSSGFGCAEPGFPGINTRTASHVSWMREQGASFRTSRAPEQVFSADEAEATPIPGVSALPSVTPPIVGDGLGNDTMPVSSPLPGNPSSPLGEPPVSTSDPSTTGAPLEVPAASSGPEPAGADEGSSTVGQGAAVVEGDDDSLSTGVTVVVALAGAAIGVLVIAGTVFAVAKHRAAGSPGVVGPAGEAEPIAAAATAGEVSSPA